MNGSFLKGTVAGLVCALIGGATVALAGSGVGGVFNLGVSNAVDAKTTLTGAAPGLQLQVTNANAAAGASGLSVNSASSATTGIFSNSSTGEGVSATSAAGVGVFAKSGGAATAALRAKNTGGGPAATFTVNSGVSPFTVNSNTKVAGLNADQVDGFDVSQIMSGGGRIGQASTVTITNSLVPTPMATVTLTAPSNGFVLVQGSIVFEDDFTSKCLPCLAFVHLLDVSANVEAPVMAGTIGDGVHGTYATIPIQWVFPVTAGSHSYTLRAAQFRYNGGPGRFDNPVLTAQFIPFGHNGSPTILSPNGENTVAAPTQTNADGTSRGTP